jgi:hypothetical protein
MNVPYSMTYFFKTTEDYEYDHELELKLANWLSKHVSNDKPFNELCVHYGYQFIEEKARDEPFKKLWEQIYSEFEPKYLKLMSAHFGIQMSGHMIAEIYKTYCDDWTIWRINFCYMENLETSGMYFYAVEVDDIHMIHFKLAEM